MKVRIETYNMFEIFLDTDSETFSLDRDYDSPGFPSLKKARQEADELRKKAMEFSPFLVMQIPLNGYGSISFKKIVGIRKDHAFIYEVDGTKKQFSKYDEKGYFIYREKDHRAAIAEIVSLEADISRLQGQMKILHSSLRNSTSSLKERKAEITGMAAEKEEED